MTPEEAYKILDQLCSMAKADRQMHYTLQKALAIFKSLVDKDYLEGKKK